MLWLTVEARHTVTRVQVSQYDLCEWLTQNDELEEAGHSCPRCLVTTPY